MNQGLPPRFASTIKRIQASKPAPAAPAIFRKPMVFGFAMISGATEFT